LGLEIIKTLTSKEAEIERLQRNIGLPCRDLFYRERGAGPGGKAGSSACIPLDYETMKKLIKSAFRRSRFACYSVVTKSISYHLLKIIEVPDEVEIESTIVGIFNSMRNSIDYLTSK
jgi:hypothetical protein